MFATKAFAKELSCKESIGRKCGEQGHWQRACRGEIEKPVDVIVPGDIVSNNWSLGEIVIHNAESRPWEAILTLNSRNFLFKLVSAANVTVLPPHEVHRQTEKKNKRKEQIQKRIQLWKMFKRANPQAYKANIVSLYSKFFEGLGEMEGECEIKLKPRAQHFAINVGLEKYPFLCLIKRNVRLTACYKLVSFLKLRSLLD